VLPIFSQLNRYLSPQRARRIGQAYTKCPSAAVPMTEYSGTRLYLGSLPRDTRKQEIEEFFSEHGHGVITEVKLMDGFGFIQYENADDARDAVPVFHGKEFKGQSLIVQFARSNNHHSGGRREFPPSGPGGFPRPRRTPFRMNISGLPPDTSWQDLKDFARKASDSVVYSDMGRDRDGRGTVEFETFEDLKRAVSHLDGLEYNGYRVTCLPDEGATAGSGGGRFSGGGGGGYGAPRGRSVSPHRGGYGGRRYSPPPPRHASPPPRYSGRSNRYDSPPHRGYRERSPGIPRGGRDPYYSSGGGRERSPPPRRVPAVDDYPPARGGAGYGGGREDYPPSRRGGGAYEDDAGYHGSHGVNGASRSSRYDESRRYPSSPPPRGGRSPLPRGGGAPPPRGGGYEDYDRRREPAAAPPPTGPKSHRSGDNYRRQSQHD